MRKSVTFVNRDGVGNAITNVQNQASCTTGSVQGKNGLIRDKKWGGGGGGADEFVFVSRNIE